MNNITNVWTCARLLPVKIYLSIFYRLFRLRNINLSSDLPLQMVVQLSRGPTWSFLDTFPT